MHTYLHIQIHVHINAHAPVHTQTSTHTRTNAHTTRTHAVTLACLLVRSHARLKIKCMRSKTYRRLLDGQKQAGEYKIGRHSFPKKVLSYADKIAHI